MTVARCATCNRPLRGRQRKFCSRPCKNSDTNNRHQSYAAQRRRARERKLSLIRLKGAKCEACGYDRNHAALEFHHSDPREKDVQLDIRVLSNRRWETVTAEAAKCILLCANCRAERHNPDCTL